MRHDRGGWGQRSIGGGVCVLGGCTQGVSLVFSSVMAFDEA